MNPETLRHALREVVDPEIGCNIVDLGLVYDVSLDDAGVVRVVMTLTTPGCPMQDSLVEGVRHVLEGTDGVAGVEVDVVWDPPWTPQRITEAGRRILRIL